ncbi:MarR family transcriptional regulator [Rhodococcus pyridinivorans]|uniref:MarR family transcriptional regulator n=1 Tax=Rhodococcus pyridinivorans TaxID=103816 RepID=UPI0022837E89|nr:MarR family transcriptional regulator [Rhodococcus pyridinivorans]WAL49326.1 MarR family transcriptional regulator [Rhodococcus pyridinivorans]
MVHTDNDWTTFDILHSLRVKGLANDAVLSALSGVPVEDLPEALNPLVEQGFVVRREGRMPGSMLTPAGKAEHLKLLTHEPDTAGSSSALESFYERFLPINSEFKQVCKRWQMRDDETPNDHSDPDYDSAVVAELTDTDARLRTPLEELADELPRFGRYLPRLSAALERVRGGDNAAFARPLYDSYHDIWMELHEDLIVSSGRTRGAADEG